MLLQFAKEKYFQDSPMRLRFKIQDILVITALVALPVAFYAPELRSLDRTSRVVLVASVIITVVALVSFTPVWIVLFWLRRRSRAGRPIGPVRYAAVFAAFLSGLGIIVAIGLAVRWLVVR
jgi:hypothetical protein